MEIFFNLAFGFFTVYIFIKSVAYGLYEIRQEKNKSGGIALICFNCAAIVLANVIMWIS